MAFALQPFSVPSITCARSGISHSIPLGFAIVNPLKIENCEAFFIFASVEAKVTIRNVKRLYVLNSVDPKHLDVSASTVLKVCSLSEMNFFEAEEQQLAKLNDEKLIKSMQEL